MKTFLKYLFFPIVILSYLAIPNNSTISNPFLSPKNKNQQTQFVLDSLNQANKQNQLEKITQFEYEKDLAEKIARFDSIQSPVYLSPQELIKYINQAYSKGFAPKEVSKELFTKMVLAESTRNIFAMNPVSKTRGLTQFKENTWKYIEQNIPYRRSI